MTRSSLCLSRPLLNWIDAYRWLESEGIRKAIPPSDLHMTLATVRDEVDWSGLVPDDRELVVPAGQKSVQIFAYTIKGLTFGHPEVSRRHAELLSMFPTMDHPTLRPHVSLYKGGRMPGSCYPGELVFGPERAEEFDLSRAHGIQHASVSDCIAGIEHVEKRRAGGRRDHRVRGR